MLLVAVLQKASKDLSDYSNTQPCVYGTFAMYIMQDILIMKKTLLFLTVLLIACITINAQEK